MFDFSTNFNLLMVSRSIPPGPGGSSIVVGRLQEELPDDCCTLVGGGRVKWPLIQSGKNKIVCATQFGIAGRGGRFFKPLRWMIYPLIRRALVKRLRGQRFTHVVGVYPDNFYLRLAVDLSQTLHLPFYMYFHNTYLDNRRGIDAWWASRIQKRAFPLAKRVFCISDGLRDYMATRYPEINGKLVTLRHIHGNGIEINAKKYKDRQGKFKVGLFGNFNASNIDATIFALNVLTELDLEVHLFSHVQRSLLKMRGIDTSRIRYRGYLEEDAFYKELSLMDMGLVTHGFTGKYSQAEYQTIFPTRMILHLQQSYPLVVVAPIDSYLARFVRDTDCGYLLEGKDGSALKRIVSEIQMEGSKTRFTEGRKSALSMFDPSKVIKTLIDELAVGQKI